MPSVFLFPIANPLLQGRSRAVETGWLSRASLEQFGVSSWQPASSNWGQWTWVAIVPKHRQVAPGTIRSIMRQAHLTQQEFNRLW